MKAYLFDGNNSAPLPPTTINNSYFKVIAQNLKLIET